MIISDGIYVISKIESKLINQITLVDPPLFFCSAILFARGASDAGSRDYLALQVAGDQL
jgi:hypothetical protein